METKFSRKLYTWQLKTSIAYSSKALVIHNNVLPMVVDVLIQENVSPNFGYVSLLKNQLIICFREDTGF